MVCLILGRRDFGIKCWDLQVIMSNSWCWACVSVDKEEGEAYFCLELLRRDGKTGGASVTCPVAVGKLTGVANGFNTAMVECRSDARRFVDNLEWMN